MVDRLHRASVSLSLSSHAAGVEFPVVLPATATNHVLVINERGSSLAYNSRQQGCSFGDLPLIAIRASLFLVAEEINRLQG